MNEDRKALADLFARLHGMGVESADCICNRCGGLGLRQRPGSTFAQTCWDCVGQGFDCSGTPAQAVLQVLGEMMGMDTPGITMGDVLTAAKRAGVY